MVLQGRFPFLIRRLPVQIYNSGTLDLRNHVKNRNRTFKSVESLTGLPFDADNALEGETGMKKERLNQTRPIFIRMLSMITLSVVVTTLIVSLLLYSSFQSFALQLVHDYAQNDLAKMGDKLVTKLAQVKTLASNVYFDTEISKLYLYDEVVCR
jgi:hypothetical protein